MNYISALRTHLSQITENIFFIRAPKGTPTPFILISEGEIVNSLTQRSGDTTYEQIPVAITIISTYEDAIAGRDMRNAAMQLLHGFAWVMGTGEETRSGQIKRLGHRAPRYDDKLQRLVWESNYRLTNK